MSVADAFNLVRATNGAAEQIVRLHVEGLAESGSLSLDADLLDVESTYRDGLFLLAQPVGAPGTIVGMGALRNISGQWHIKRMRVAGSHRRRGIAQCILDRLIAHA